MQRRRILAGTGVALSATLAGCTGDDEDDNDDGTIEDADDADDGPEDDDQSEDDTDDEDDADDEYAGDQADDDESESQEDDGDDGDESEDDDDTEGDEESEDDEADGGDEDDEPDDEEGDEDDEDEVDGEDDEDEVDDEDDEEEEGDDEDDEDDISDEISGQVEYRGEHQDLYEVTDHGIEWWNDDGENCEVDVTVENLTDDYEMNVHYGVELIDESGSVVSQDSDQLWLEPGDAASNTVEAYDCHEAAEYRIGLEAVHAENVGGEDGD
jgi:hypothetical protein